MKSTPIQNILAVLLVISIMSFFFWISYSDKATNNQHIGQIMIALTATLGIITGYFFGSSQDAKKKAEIVENLIAPKDGSTTITTKSPDPAVIKANSDAETKKEELKQNDLNNNNQSS